ncbi:MAG: hypothetical protein ISS31_01280 [Kiritimatiellae bacterium]|nr:hypothetical protein [Kiritimatiellia bacterium]
MMSEIKALLRDRGQMTLRQLARHFKMAPEAIEPMLRLLVDKGQLTTSLLCGGGCSGCGCANEADLTLYKLANGD